MNPNIEKYKSLYEYHQDLFSEGRLRFQRLEDKAFKYLTSLTVAFSAYLLLIRSVYSFFKAPYDMFSILVFISMAITFYSSCCAWSFIFRAIRLQTLVKMPYGKEIIDTFDKNKRASIYRSMAKKYSDALTRLDDEYEKKLCYVRKGYSEVAFTGWSFLISVTLIFVNLWR